uniref:Uncharacterized protein n=1 Tax=Arundo donax TaxID=35708 RepID=A0A0A9EEU3_ARUDO
MLSDFCTMQALVDETKLNLGEVGNIVVATVLAPELNLLSLHRDHLRCIRSCSFFYIKCPTSYVPDLH